MDDETTYAEHLIDCAEESALACQEENLALGLAVQAIVQALSAVVAAIQDHSVEGV